jgi:hypothetical protein
MRWLFAALLVLPAHFAASYLVPLDREAQATFGGLLRGHGPGRSATAGSWAESRLRRIPHLRGLARRAQH